MPRSWFLNHIFQWKKPQHLGEIDAGRVGVGKTQNQFATYFVSESKRVLTKQTKACQGDTRANLKDPLMAKSGTI